MPEDLTSLQHALGSSDPLNWVFTGDSITHGLVHTQGARNYVDHLHELIRGDLGRARDAVINTANSGWRIVQLLEDFSRRVATWRPDIVSLMIGTNDCSTGGVFPIIEPAEFAASVTEFVGRVRELGAVPVLQTQPAVDVANAPERARIADFAQAVRDVAATEDIVLIDQFARFEQLGGGGVPWGMLNDPFHPNAAGHAVMALEIADVLGIRAAAGSRVVADLEAQVAVARRVG